ncbi:lectin subunit alpha-like [Lucilia sericata]|uniref:lectin subunit alpha-like n=1 Tax=Lucilia sericata TaxID=13632 RepID=UPI0018A83D7A|nr:lectin subunit alpha-like [Lucilia sericata]
MAKSLQFLVILLICLTKLYYINCNENVFISGLKNVYYIESEQKFTFYDALAKCASMNMSLVTIDTKLKSQDITALLTDIFGKRIPLWIGGVVNGNNPRQFVWLATGKKFTYTNWGPSQPDFAGNNEYCAQTGWTNAMEWNDHVCSNQYGFMCEYSRYHRCQEEMQTKLQEDMKNQQHFELKKIVEDMLPKFKNIDGESRTFRDIILNINPYNK